MNLLTGEYKNTLDDKGRFLFPAKLRSALSSNVLIVTQAIVDRCLWLFTPEEWEKISSKLMDNASPFSAKNRLIMRSFISPAQEIEFDKAGRLSIPQSLREYASLSKDCIVLGVNKYLELWDSSSYNAYLSENEANLLEASEELNSISFL
ncbi:MAG: division/cell wall cluster transcriptional repressor MraZ [Spirochaetia bacterium]|nr:division/cell wall cluster transcriptional repressor MraZ [Spirochaetia bacterium]MDD5777081.1 division/cell wall cluster transcriptional repressor MraZ [Treponema sp.]MCI5609741.1 division/cell wall cluster transcriptional repressor MraZ [Spirochaetia bacterium]MCI7563432.1 division/cell wall cluster transcriptional repressor MraZ [Spirochaetia bacterium]MCI7798168.1 division/cell wall cluster transcriptional repressor MraZ [Spirochaetia bacterium]